MRLQSFRLGIRRGPLIRPNQACIFYVRVLRWGSKVSGLGVRRGLLVRLGLYMEFSQCLHEVPKGYRLQLRGSGSNPPVTALQ